MRSDAVVLGKAEQAKSCSEPEGDAPLTQRCAQAGAWDELRWSPGAAAPGDPHPGRGAATAPVKVEEENANSNNGNSSIIGDKRDEAGQKFCSGKIAI